MSIDLNTVGKRQLVRNIVVEMIGNERLHERYGVPEIMLAKEQQDADDLRRLYYKNLLTDSEVTNARKRLAATVAGVLKMKSEVPDKVKAGQLAEAVSRYIRCGELCKDSHPYRELIAYMYNDSMSLHDADRRCRRVADTARWFRQMVRLGERSKATVVAILSWEVQRYHDDIR